MLVLYGAAKDSMASRTLLYLSLFAFCVLVAMVTLTEAHDVDTADTDLQHRVERRSLTEALLARRSVNTEGETGDTGRRKGRRGKKGRGKGKGRRKGRKNKGPPQYTACIHPANGLTCTCDMRFEKFKNHPVKQYKYYTIC